MEKLEIKHLKGYLGTGLKLEITLGKKYVFVSDNWGLKTGSDYPISYYDDCNRFGLMMSQVKPILYPLTYLTKEQINHLENIFGDISKLTDTMLVGSFVPNGIVEKLYEWHFDVHGLIEKGLAISKTTLK